MTAVDRDQFFRSLSDATELLELFDFLPEAYLYVKNREGQFMHTNRAWREMRGFADPAEVLGKTDFDLHPDYLAEQYVAEDRRVMEQEAAIPNQVWLVPGAEERLSWFISSKIPLRGKSGEIVGVAGVMRDFEKTEDLARPYRRMERVLSHVAAHYGSRIDLPALARAAGLSVSQFNRQFKSLFQMTPKQYITRVRIHEATRRLAESDLAISEIAVDCGFYDQAHFSRSFRAHMGLSPLAFRKQSAVQPRLDL